MFTVEEITREADLSSNPSTFLNTAVEKGWTEGLPVLLPKSSDVKSFLVQSGWSSDDTVGTFSGDPISYGQVSACCVMAGCDPAFAPIIQTAAAAILHKDFDLPGLLRIRGPYSPLLIISGEIVDRLGFATGHGVFAGAGSYKNMSIGRTLALLVLNAQADIDRSKQPLLGGPNLLFSCVAENSANWVPIHRDRGVSSPSAVTVIGTGSHNGAMVRMAIQRSVTDALDIIADALTSLGNLNTIDLNGETLVTFSPLIVEILKKDQWSRSDIQKYLYENACRRIEDLANVGIYRGRRPDDRASHQLIKTEAEEGAGRLRVFPSQDAIICIQCGGDTQFWASVSHGAGLYGGRAVTLAIEP